MKRDAAALLDDKRGDLRKGPFERRLEDSARARVKNEEPYRAVHHPVGAYIPKDNGQEGRPPWRVAALETK